MKPGFTRIQWWVLISAWLGWGFDGFDALLFNYLAPDCIPRLLHLAPGSEEARQAFTFWTGVLSSTLLVGWACGGIFFGRLADRIGRGRVLVRTMLLYSVGTACCALAANPWMLLIFRFLAGLGIGGEWAAGASMVAEVVPDRWRLEAGALLYTAAPAGIFLASSVAHWSAHAFAPEMAWRYAFLMGLGPAAVAMAIRHLIPEPERWQELNEAARSPELGELFTPEFRRATFSGVSMAVTALLAWWSCNSFLPLLAVGLAKQQGEGLSPEALKTLVDQWRDVGPTLFLVGGVLGTLLTVPLARHLGRRPTFAIYYLITAGTILGAFGLKASPLTRLHSFFFIGLATYGVLGSFTYYLTELYPTRLRGTGSGFCYNVGRFLTAVGPFWVGQVAARAGGFENLESAMVGVGLIPLVGLCLLPWVTETRDRALD